MLRDVHCSCCSGPLGGSVSLSPDRVSLPSGCSLGSLGSSYVLCSSVLTLVLACLLARSLLLTIQRISPPRKPSPFAFILHPSQTISNPNPPPLFYLTSSF